jgi:hypothetical protein
MTRKHFRQSQQFSEERARGHTCRLRIAASDRATYSVFSIREMPAPSWMIRVRLVDESGSVSGWDPQAWLGGPPV